MDEATAPTHTTDIKQAEIYWMLTNGHISDRCNKCGCDKMMFGCTSENGVITFCATDEYKSA
tara:strand:+ start:9945 stop:10130 length:186 start_codon:yes stop_codon:yes gene_type:complete